LVKVLIQRFPAAIIENKSRPKIESKVLQGIHEMCNPPIEPWKTIKPEEYTYVKKGNGDKEIDVWTKTRVIWQNI
jgi:hypothetical protein